MNWSHSLLENFYLTQYYLHLTNLLTNLELFFSFLLFMFKMGP